MNLNINIRIYSCGCTIFDGYIKEEPQIIHDKVTKVRFTHKDTLHIFEGRDIIVHQTRSKECSKYGATKPTI